MMPKRSRKRKSDDEDSDEYFRKKIRKLEKKLRRRKRISSDSSSNDSTHNTLLSLHKDITASGDNIPESELVDNYDFVCLDDETENYTSTANGTSVAVPINDTLTADTKEISANDVQTKENPPSDATPAIESNEPELDKDILELLGETPSKEKKYGSNIKNELAVRWNHILTTGLTKEVRKDLIDKYLIPENCKNIDAPVLNPETKAALSDVLVKKDKAIASKQKQRAAAISSLGEALTRIIDLGLKDATIIKPLLDAARLICDLQHTDSLIRRSFICSTLKKEIKDQLYNTDIDQYLFSKKLADALKAAKAIQRTGIDMKMAVKTPKKPATTNRPLNSKPPLPTGRSAGVPRKQEPAKETVRRYQPAQPSTSAQSRPQQRSQAQGQQRRR